MIATPEQAVDTVCPFTMTQEAPRACLGPACMGWQWVGWLRGDGIIREAGREPDIKVGVCGLTERREQVL